MQKPPDLDESGKPITSSRPPDLDDSGNIIEDELSKAREVLARPAPVITPEPVAKPAKSKYQQFWDTAASYIPEPVKSGWKSLWNPLTDLPSRAGNFLQESGVTSLPAGPMTVSPRFAGDILSGMTSPGNIIMTALTGGENLAAKAALPRIAQLLAYGSKASGIGMGVHGTQAVLDPESTLSQRGMGALEAIGGSLVAAHGARVPSAEPIELPISRPSSIESIVERPPDIPAETSVAEAPTSKPSSTSIPGPDELSGENKAFLDGLPDDALEGFINRHSTNPNYDTPTGRGMLNHARSLLEEKRNNPSVPISKELPKQLEATNLTLEDKANMELWYKYRRMFNEGKIKDDPNDPLMIEWAKIHNKVKDLKPNGTVTLSPYRFNELPPEEPKFTEYILPNGERVNLDTSATKGADTTSFQMKGGEIVEAKRADLEPKPFDPGILGFESNTPKGVDFVDPNTGEIKSASEAKPGDVPIVPENKSPLGESEPSPAKPPAKVPGRKRIILTEGPKQTTEQPVSQRFQAIFNASAQTPPNEPWSSVGQMPTNQSSIPINNPPLTPAGVPRQYGPKLPSNRTIGPRLPPRPPTNPPASTPPPAGPIRNLLNIHKAALTSGDLSAPGRQGKALMLNKAWWTSWDDMIKAFGSKQASDVVHDSIINHPSGYFKDGVTATGGKIPSLARRVGLELPEHEEMFTGNISSKFGGWIDRSSRAHTAFLNKLRSDQFVSMMEASKRAGVDPEMNLNIARAYAKFINDATGRGSVNIGKWKMERNMTILNDIFFAPKNMSGQIRTWNNVLNPIKYANYDPVLRKQALRSLFAVAGMGMGVGELARLKGAQVSNDPTNSDFRKIRVGDTRIDPFGGYQQFPVAAMKFMSGKSTSSVSGKVSDLTSSRFGAQTRGDVAERFFTNRLSPLGSFVWAWMFNKEFDGKPFEVKRALYERTLPIAAKDIYDLAQEDPFLATLLAPLTITGLVGTQHYSGRY